MKPSHPKVSILSLLLFFTTTSTLFSQPTGIQTIWEKTYTGKYGETGYSIIETADGGYVFTGTKFINQTAKNDVWVVKLDMDGKQLWEKTFGESNVDYTRAITISPDGSYLLLDIQNYRGEGRNNIRHLQLNLRYKS